MSFYKLDVSTLRAYIGQQRKEKALFERLFGRNCKDIKRKIVCTYVFVGVLGVCGWKSDGNPTIRFLQSRKTFFSVPLFTDLISFLNFCFRKFLVTII